MNARRIQKNVTFATGLGWLLYGAASYGLPDWDLGVSLVMAGFTYGSADWVVDVVRHRQYKEWLKAAFITWFSVSGCYAAYWLLVGHPERMVEGQWVTSLCLYLLCGVIWSCLPTPREALGLFRRTTAGSGRTR